MFAMIESSVAKVVAVAYHYLHSRDNVTPRFTTFGVVLLYYRLLLVLWVSFYAIIGPTV